MLTARAPTSNSGNAGLGGGAGGDEGGNTGGGDGGGGVCGGTHGGGAVSYTHLTLPTICSV
eukprot:4380317-Prymnesium_polylepis.1